MATTNNFTFGVDVHPFTLNFPFIDEDNLVVTLDGVVKTLDTDYTVINKTSNTAAGVGFLSGARIQFTANPLPTTGVVKVVRNTNLETTSTFKTGSAIRAIDLNSNFTQNLYVTEEISNNAILTDGSNAFDGDLNMGGNQITNLGTPATDSDAVTKLYVDSRVGSSSIPGYTRWRTTATASQTVFSGVGESGGTLAYSATRENVYVNGALQQRTVDYTADNGTTITFIVGLQAGDIVDVVCVNNVSTVTSDQSSELYFLQSGTGATTRTVESKLKDVVSVKDFGAVGDGVTDDTDKFSNAISALPTNGGTLYVQSGNYIVIGPVNSSNKYVQIKAEDGAKLNNTNGWANYNTYFGNTVWLNIYSPQLGRNVLRSYSPTNSDFTLFDKVRTADYTGGTGGSVSSLDRNQVIIESTVGSLGNRKAEKASVNTVTNNSDHANAVGLMCQAVGNANGALWSLESNTIANTVPTQYAQRSAEFNIQCTGADANELRWIVDIVSHSLDLTYSGVETVFTGLHISPGSADMEYGALLREDSLAEYRSAALRIEARAASSIETRTTLSNIISHSSDVSTNNSIICQTTNTAVNSSAADIDYTKTISQIITNTAGAENGAYRIDVMAGGTSTTAFRLNGSLTNAVELLVNGSLKRVTEGAADSGGTGFKVLRVPN